MGRAVYGDCWMWRCGATAYAQRMRRLAVLLVAAALVAAGYGIGEINDRDPAPVVDTTPAIGPPLEPLCMRGQRNLDSPWGCVDLEAERMTPAERQRRREALAKVQADLEAP